MKHFPPFPRAAHSGSGQARIKVNGRHVYLGVFGSAASHAEYRRLKALWEAGRPTTPPRRRVPSSLRLVRDLIHGFLQWAKGEFTQRDGTVRQELANLVNGLRPLLVVYGETELADFTAQSLEDLLAVVAAGTWPGAKKPWSRHVANAALSRWRKVWKWGESKGHVPPGTYGNLRTVAGLAEGKAAEHNEVPPVAEADLEKTLPHLAPWARAAVELLRLTGARPTEILSLVPAAIGKGGVVELAPGYLVKLPVTVWATQPRKHKGKRKGKRRVILYGPRAQAVLAPLLEGRADDAWLFPSPAGGRRDFRSLRRAVLAGCQRAGVSPWYPYQVRHLASTALSLDFGPVVASVVLGHEHAATSVIYSLPNLQAAAEAMARIG